MADDGILGAQWCSFDHGMTWERTPASLTRDGKHATTMTVVGVNHGRGEVTVRMDLVDVFGMRKSVTHALAEFGGGAIRAYAVCGEVVSGTVGPGPWPLPYEARTAATCERCKNG